MEETRFYFEEPKAQTDPEGDLSKSLVKRALWIIQQNLILDNEKSNSFGWSGQGLNISRTLSYDQIIKDYENAGSTKGQYGSHFVFSKRTYSVVQKIKERWMFPKFSVVFKRQVLGKDEEQEKIEEQILTRAVEFVLREGGLKTVWAGKGGVNFKAPLLGDAMIMIETTDDRSFPINFRMLSLDRIYITPEASSMRYASDRKNVKQLSYIVDYDYDSFMNDWGDTMKKEGVKPSDIVWGDIPSDLNNNQRLNQTNEQYSIEEGDRKGQICIYYDIEKKGEESYIVFAGSNAKIIKSRIGKDYRFFIKQGEKRVPYIPVSHIFCKEKVTGFWNMGYGHLVSEINQLDDFMKNQFIMGLLKSINPLDTIVVGENKALEAQYRIEQASLDRLQGQHGLVINELDGNGNPLIGNIQSLTSGDTSQAYERFQTVISEYDTIDLGVNTKDASTPASKTATAIETEEAAQQAAIQVLTEQNTGEIKFLIEVAIDFIRKFVSENDNTPLDTRDITMPMNLVDEALQGVDPEIAERMRPQLERQIREKSIRDFTLGEASRILKDKDMEVEVKIQSGSAFKPSSTRRLQNKQFLLNLVLGTKAHPIILREISEELGTPLRLADLQPVGAEQQGGQQMNQQQLNQTPEQMI